MFQGQNDIYLYIKMYSTHTHTHNDGSPSLEASEHKLCLGFLNDVVEVMRLLMKCLFLNCHKPTDGPVTSPISPQTVNPSGEYYHWSIPHRPLLRWLCLPAHCWSLIYSPCLWAHRAEPHGDLRNEGTAIPASHPSSSGLVSIWT